MELIVDNLFLLVYLAVIIVLGFVIGSSMAHISNSGDINVTRVVLDNSMVKVYHNNELLEIHEINFDNQKVTISIRQ